MYKYDSKILPFECAFKYDEEFCFEDPVLKENCKAVVTKAGNCVTMVQCSSMGTWVTKMTVGNCFMTSVSFKVQKLIPQKIIFVINCELFFAESPHERVP